MKYTTKPQHTCHFHIYILYQGIVIVKLQQPTTSTTIQKGSNFVIRKRKSFLCLCWVWLPRQLAFFLHNFELDGCLHSSENFSNAAADQPTFLFSRVCCMTMRWWILETLQEYTREVLVLSRGKDDVFHRYIRQPSNYAFPRASYWIKWGKYLKIISKYKIFNLYF